MEDVGSAGAADVHPVGDPPADPCDEGDARPVVLLPLEVWTEILKHAYPRKPDKRTATVKLRGVKSPVFYKYRTRGKGSIKTLIGVKRAVFCKYPWANVENVLIKEHYSRTVYRKEFK